MPLVQFLALFLALSLPHTVLPFLATSLSQCQGMHADWREQEPLRKRLAFSYLESGSPYHTCRKMTKCEERSSAPCKAYVLSEKREFRPTFVVPASVCTPSCYVCQWLVSDWPFFGEYCNALTGMCTLFFLSLFLSISSSSSSPSFSSPYFIASIDLYFPHTLMSIRYRSGHKKIQIRLASYGG